MSTQKSTRLEAKVAIVTGSGKGIGEAIATLFAREGASVVVNARSEDDIDRVVSEISKSGNTAHGVAADIGTIEGVTSLVTATVKRFHHVDILVHNAGVFPYDPLEKMTDESWQTVMNVNLNSAFRLARACLADMCSIGKDLYYWMPDHSPRSLVEKVDYISGAGYLDGGGTREQVRLIRNEIDPDGMRRHGFG